MVNFGESEDIEKSQKQYFCTHCDKSKVLSRYLNLTIFEESVD